MIPPDDVRRFFAEYFGMEKDAIPMGMRTMLDEIRDAVAEMNRGIRGYLPQGPEVRGLLEGGDGGIMGLLGWDAPTEQELEVTTPERADVPIGLARTAASGMSMEDASHLTEMMRTPAQPREEAQPEPSPEQTVEQEQTQEPDQPKSEWEERDDLDADLEEPFDPNETEGAWRPRESGGAGMENENGEVAYDWKEENGLLVAEEDGEPISGGRENFQDEEDEALGNITEALPSVEGNVVYLQTGQLEPGATPAKLVVFGELSQAIAGALDAANVSYRDNFDSIDEKMEEGKETRDGDAYDESHYKVTISGKKNVQAAIQALVGDNGDYGAAVLQDEGGSIRILLNPKSVDMEGVTTLAQAQAENEQLKQDIEERNRQAIAAWEARTGLKYDPEWREHIVRPDGPFREVNGSTIREGTIRNGEWDGEVREYRDGVLRKTAIYKNGSETGTRKLYRGDGTLALDRFFNEDGNAVEIHYGKDGKTEDYRLVRGKRGVVLFDSRKQEEAPAEPAAQPEPEQKPSAGPKFKRVREPIGEHGAYMEGIKEDGHWVGEVKYFPAANDKLPEMIQHYDGLGRLERIQTMYSTDRSKVYTETFYYADGTSLQATFAPNGDRVRSVSIDVNGRETILYSRQLERFRQNLEEAKGSKHLPKEAIDWELLTSDNEGLRIAEGVLFYVKDLDRQDAEPNLDKKQRESERRRSQTKLREYRKKALALQEELQKRRGQGGNVALSIGGRTTGAEFNDVRPADVGRQKRAGAYYPDIGQWLANTAFSIGERRKAEYRAVIGKKRPDLPSADVDAFMGELDKLDDTKREKTALHWFVKGGLQLPQEAETLKKALEVSAAFGIDPFRTGTPQEVLRMASQMAQARSKELQGPFLGPEDIGLTHLPPDTPVHVEGNENDTSMTVGDEQNGIYEFYSDNELTERALYKDGKRVKDLPLDGDIAPFNTALSLGDGFKQRLDSVDEGIFRKLEPLTRGEDAHLHREGFGDVRYPFSDSDKRGREAATGFVHIVRQRLRKDVDDLDDAVAIAVLVADAVENGEKKSGRSSNTTYFDKDGVRAVVGTHEDGEKVVTGFQIWESEEEKANANFRSATRASVPHGSSEEMVASLATIIANRLGNGSANTAFSVGSRPGRAPVVEPGGDVREAGEGALAWLRRKFVHSQTPVFDAVRRVMGVGREPPDALNVEAAAKNVHGKIRARQEMLQRAYLEPLKAILAQPGMDRKRFDDYALALHALERNRMIQERSVVVDPTTGEVVDLGVEAGSGVTNAWAERVIREIQRDPFAQQYKEAANILAEMNRFVLRGAVADGLLTEAQAATWMRLSPHYVPLKSGGAAPGAIHKRATGRFTRPDSVLVNSMRQAYATVRNGELNRVNKTMADWIREYDPNGEQVGGTVPESHKHAKIKMAEPQYVPKGSSAEALLRERGIRLVETEDNGGYWVDTGVLPNALKRVVRESVPQGDDIVTFWENGERKFIRFEGKRGRDGTAENEAARIADALNFKNVLHKEGRFWDAIRGLTRWKANVSTSWNPTFIVRNMGADVFNTANLMMIEGKYAELARTMRNYPEALNRVERSSHAWVSFTDGVFPLAEVA